ncbi:hypothetical protein LAUMK40_04730 [Mycobacterium kansasii]|nr:hypothetical protein LAUMK40_04730 [Mycobacterium kansasii]
MIGNGGNGGNGGTGHWTGTGGAGGSGGKLVGQPGFAGARARATTNSVDQ